MELINSSITTEKMNRMDKNRLVFLWSEVTGYVQSLMEELVSKFEASINVVHWDRKKKNSTQFLIGAKKNIKFYGRSRTNDKEVRRILDETAPTIVVVSGWMDKGYIKVCKAYKKDNPSVKIIAGIDDQWKGTMRQHLGRVYYRIFYKKLFDYLWVAGKPQFSYAQHFGYRIDNIVSNLYSADSKLFKPSGKVSRRFVFVGRFDPIKALDVLVDAYCSLTELEQQRWPLYLIGDGEQREMILAKNNPNIIVKPFMQPENLRMELAEGGVGCLTSHQDQWGVVIHEYALMGFPLLLSTGCGASTEFLIPGYNGFIFKKGDRKSLSEALRNFTKLGDDELMLFSNRSVNLGNRINTEQAAASLLSVAYL